MAKEKRSRQSTGDMVRSLGLVMLLVLVVFFFARPPSGDAKKIRVVDPTSDVQAFAAQAPAGAVPRSMPSTWRSTVSTFDPETNQLRIGWVTPGGRYAEYAATTHAPPVFLTDITGEAPRVGTVDIDGVTWQEYRKDGATSLVHEYGVTTVVLGTLRDTATLDELRVLAGRLSP